MYMYRDRKGNYHKKPLNIVSKERVSSYGIYIQNKKILLVKPSWVDIWEFPGGGQEVNEELFDTLKREFLEETGFEILQFETSPLATINTKFFADDLNEYFDSKMYFFMIKKIGNQNKTLINHKEIIDIKYISISDLNKKNMNNIHFEILKKIDGQN